MTEVRMRALLTLVMMICAALFFGIGVNYYVGFGVLIALWSIAGLVELNRD